MKVTDEMVEAACRAFSEASFGEPSFADYAETRREYMIRSAAIGAAINAALAAAPQPEPVAWRCWNPEHDCWEYRTDSPRVRRQYPAWTPLYTAPQPAPDALREAARMALEALEALQGGCTDSDDGTVESITVWCPEVIDALRAALGEEK